MSDAAYRDALPFIARTYSRKFGVTIEVKGTHAYDIICSIGSRVARQYQD